MLGKNFVSTSVSSSHTPSCQYLGIITRYWTRKIYEAILAKPWNGYWVSEWQGKTMITQKLVKHITGIWGNLPNCFSSILHCRLVGKAGPDVWLRRRPSEDVRSWNKITFLQTLIAWADYMIDYVAKPFFDGVHCTHKPYQRPKKKTEHWTAAALHPHPEAPW